jgi:hypothetical protein
MPRTKAMTINRNMTPESNARKIMDSRLTISEAGASNTIPAIDGMKALNFIDISDPDNPMIYIKGMYSVSYITGRRDIVRRMREITERVEKGNMSVIDLSRLFGFMPPRYIGDETPTVIQAFAEAEILLQTPAVKAKLSRARMRKV